MKKEFEKIQEKFSLPAYKDLNAFFLIESLDKDTLTIKEIRQKMVEKLAGVSHVIEDILQPEADYATLFESKEFGKKDREEIYQLYRKIRYLIRKSNLLSLEEISVQSADWIKETFKEWKIMMPKLKKIFSRLKECWLKEFKELEQSSYTG